MALVAYDNSDSSEFEDEENDSSTTPVVLLNKKDEVSEPSVSDSATQIEEETSSQSLFNLLPRPSHKTSTVLEEDDEFLQKKGTVTPAVKPKAKITVPSLSDFRDVGDTVPAAKPRKVNGKKSGLLSMLPEPKNAVMATSKSLIPHVLTRKPMPNVTPVKKKLLPSVKKNKPDTLGIDSDDSDNDEVQNDFFSMNKPADLRDLPEDMPLDIDEKVSQKKEQPRTVNSSIQKQPRDIESYFKPDPVENQNVQEDYSMSSSSSMGYNTYNGNSGYGNQYLVTQETNNAVLDEEAILKLCGTRGKRKREDIQIVDVNQQEVLADAREWLVKGLMDDTTKRMSSSKRRGDEPTNQQKRKHQITYLAHQAKANEAELQNQWANNRMSKRQTQSKYGF